LRRPTLRAQLNQIRLWVRQGRTDAWIAHKLDISVQELEQFKRDQGLGPDGSPPPRPEPEPVAEPEPAEPEPAAEAEGQDEEQQPEPQADVADPPRRRRRGRRGGRRRGGESSSYEGTLDHGDEGYGLWLDPAVADNEVYSEHWEGHRAVTVTVEPDAITIRRAESREDRD
jgi:hypothetical protein